MNKAELIEALSAHYDGSKSEAAKALNAVTQTITHQTAAGEKVSITGFGVFEKVPRAARMVRNPRTGERKQAKATAVPRFRAGTDLKAYVSGEKKVPKAVTAKAPSAKKAAARTSTAKTSTAKTSTAKASTAKATPATKTAAKKAPATKTPATKTAATKSAAKKAPAKKTPAKKTPAKKTSAG